ncbi:Protein restricted to Verrucomicrobia-Planctomycetes group [Limihaloglobus sulfuriphilus]|uniref:Protein restricted to Verrucomicrobia-Planctomycetes group n=1 Tax=Limihaloglobus sulfuriphilus TaxID=1851148 RepID=A0A1Q2MBM3_9BACT|nr:Minf_1886 family protein [Limihaloglobus sulfuriphilus]AQQ70081.1 Protein restricted to Verrucomicrobia-Planctomycetes group [Limihaloglobus sulfuriphilus]
MNGKDKRTEIRKLAKTDSRYHPDAFFLVCDGLEHAVTKLRKNVKYPADRHISGKELSSSIAELALDRWGYMTRIVLKRWGVEETLDFGEIVYLMIDNKLMSSQPGDTIQDFVDVFDFEDVFEKKFRIKPLEK